MKSNAQTVLSSVGCTHATLKCTHCPKPCSEGVAVIGDGKTGLKAFPRNVKDMLYIVSYWLTSWNDLFFFFLELLPKYDVNLTKYLQALHRQYNPCIAAHILKIPLSIITEL